MDARCRHDETEPVVLSTGETVAKVCIDCLARLDYRWGCDDCDWEDIYTVESLTPVITVLTHDCGAHLEQKMRRLNEITEIDAFIEDEPVWTYR